MFDVGVDIVNITYISKMESKYGEIFSKKVLSDSEFEIYLKKNRRKIEFLAGRFAAKEAFFKSTNLEIEFKDISIINDCFGKPIIEIDSLKYSKKINCKVSISHHLDYAIAVVIVEMEEKHELEKRIL